MSDDTAIPVTMPPGPPLADRIAAAMARITRQIRRELQASIRAAGRTVARFSHQIAPLEHRRRCPVCRPYSNPRPLRLGPAYRSRRRGRW